MGIQTREVNGAMLDTELKEYLDLKFNELERHIEMVFDHKKDVSIKKILLYQEASFLPMYWKNI